MKNFDTLLKSELKKVQRYVMKRDSVKAVVSAWWTEEKDEFTEFYMIGCEIVTEDYSERLEDVYINCFMLDRRKSFVVDGAENWITYHREHRAEESETIKETVTEEKAEEIENEKGNKMMTSEEYRAMFEADRNEARETVRSWRDAVSYLDNQQSVDNIDGETPDHTVKCFVAQVGEDLARFIIASLVNRSSWDGRIYPSVKEWAENQKSLSESVCVDAMIHTEMHMAHLNQIAQSMMKYEPEEETTTEGEEIAENEEEVNTMTTENTTTTTAEETAETEQQKTDRENREHCKHIADELEAVASGRVYKCPECGELIEWDNSAYNEDEQTYTCTQCGKTFDECDLEPVGMLDYFADVLDIEYRIGSDREFRSVRLLVAYGGPNIYIDTWSQQVELYWWTDRASFPLSSEVCDQINADFEELFNC